MLVLVKEKRIVSNGHGPCIVSQVFRLINFVPRKKIYRVFNYQSSAGQPPELTKMTRSGLDLKFCSSLLAPRVRFIVRLGPGTTREVTCSSDEGPKNRKFLYEQSTCTPRLPWWGSICRRSPKRKGKPQILRCKLLVAQSQSDSHILRFSLFSSHDYFSQLKSHHQSMLRKPIYQAKGRSAGTIINFDG